jgi:hypothetical protein
VIALDHRHGEGALGGDNLGLRGIHAERLGD